MEYSSKLLHFLTKNIDQDPQVREPSSLSNADRRKMSQQPPNSK